MRVRSLLAGATLAALLGACTDLPTEQQTPPAPPGTPPRPLGVYEFAITGLGTAGMQSSVSAPEPAAQAGGPSRALSSLGAGIVFEQMSSSSFTEGTRGQGGQRYVSFTYRVRNGTGAPINNLTILMVSRAGTIAGTPVSQLRRFDGTAANPAIASRIVPTGAVALDRGGAMEALYPDVLQVLTEAEAAAVPRPGDVTDVFPYGYVVRRTDVFHTRLLPPAGPNQYDGLLTLSFRLPLQPTVQEDVFSFFFQVLAVDDSEVRVTQSIEEQTTVGYSRFSGQALQLGATTRTLLPGAQPWGYAGERRICSVRTAGPAGQPATLITAPGAYTRLAAYMPGEAPDPCLGDFKAGTAAKVGVGDPVLVTFRAMDRYGNPVQGAVDTVTTASATDPGAHGVKAALQNGSGTAALSFGDYGVRPFSFSGRRLRGDGFAQAVPVTRTWTGSVSSSWAGKANWAGGVTPFTRDTVVVPAGVTFMPILSAPDTIGGLAVAEGSYLLLYAQNLWVLGDVFTGPGNSAVTSTTGRLYLAGWNANVSGRLPLVTLTGNYTQSGHLALRTPAEITDGGSLESVGWLTEFQDY
ncbi:MAG TPA: hypothetical protein VF665_12150 [Longimicrobium sp.]|jgi:hypothetical protein|uniref:hypothetical protein n=1 Tax=Longimicrobium sp. TaxID=2029185 RepID=UPI002ED9F3B4